MQTITFQLREGEVFIPLISLLKAVNLVYSGSEAQDVVVDGLVKRNGAIELRKRAKIMAGDVVEFQGYRIIVES
ncbi:MAG: RNA-binding S4 domain-containing protein [Bacteroidales bacterium]|nr:RNA-binding S4 domain-containing protein [Bacteroidales bacterium]